MILLSEKNRNSKNSFYTYIKNIVSQISNSDNRLIMPIKFIYHFIQKVKQNIIFNIELLLSQKFKILSSDQCGESILLLKEKSIERTYFSKVYNFTENGWIDFLYPKMEVRKFTDVRIYSSSDFIITKDGAIWDKFFKPQWAKIIPLDKALLKIKNQYIFVKKAKHIQTIEIGYSLCGVHSTVWAHFLVQYIPKLYLLKEIQSIVSLNLTVIIPHYKDLQIKELVYTYLNQFKEIQILELKTNEVANCKILYYIENTAQISDHAKYVNPSDVSIPRFTLELLKNNLVNYLNEDYLNSQNIPQLPYRKLYIGRSGPRGSRNIENHEEIEKYFVCQGFEVVYPHLLTLKEKVKTFREASIIIGPYSSGFINILFCNVGVKALGFINFHATFDGYGSTLAKYFGVDLMFVNGSDKNDSIHSSYFVPLEKIKSAYQELLS